MPEPSKCMKNSRSATLPNGLILSVAMIRDRQFSWGVFDEGLMLKEGSTKTLKAAMKAAELAASKIKKPKESE